jgi:NADH:ubiquinone oxidoreductase subunit 6 (subunit J)
MKGKTAAALVMGIAMIGMLGGMVLSTDWHDDEGMNSIPFAPSDDVDFTDTLNFALFETYGPVMLVVSLLLFGAIIGSAAISQEEEEE